MNRRIFTAVQLDHGPDAVLCFGVYNHCGNLATRQSRPSGTQTTHSGKLVLILSIGRDAERIIVLMKNLARSCNSTGIWRSFTRTHHTSYRLKKRAGGFLHVFGVCPQSHYHFEHKNG